MLRMLSVFFVALLLSFPASSKPNPPPSASAEPLQQQIRQLQTDLTAAKNNQEDHDKLIILTKGLMDLEKRVEDIHGYVAGLGHDIALFAALLTVLIIYFSFRVSREAKIEAQQAAEKEVKNWIDKKGDKAIKPLEESLQNKGAEILTSIVQQSTKTLKKIEAEADQHHQQLNAIEDRHKALLNRAEPSPDEKGKVLDPKDMGELLRITEPLRLKPEDQYTFDDWRVLYLEAGNRKVWDEVDVYVAGMERTATNDWQNVSAKTGRAWLLLNRQQYVEAIKLCDQLVDQWGANDEPRLIERVASAFLNKGSALNQQGQWEASIAVYDDLVSHYGARNEAGIAERVAMALLNKGWALSQQGQWEGAIAVYDDLVSRYGARSEAGIAEQVSSGLLNKGYELSEQSQWEDAIAVYDDLVSRYGARREAGIIEAVAKAQFNRAIALSELKRTFEAKMAYAMFIERYASRTESEILALVEQAKKTINELNNV